MIRVRLTMKVGLIALAVASGQAAARVPLDVPPGLSDAWRRYQLTDAAREPGRDFPHLKCFRQSASDHDVPLTLLLAIARGESGFEHRAVSRANALGLMQILWPETAKHLGIHRRAALFEPCTNIDAGARYLKELLARYGGDLHRTLAAYNYGPARVPRDDGAVPRGAQWYSGYIYRHLSYVLDRSPTAVGTAPRAPYEHESKLELIAFSTPYRAAAFVQILQETAPGIRLDWFRENAWSYRVMVLYRDQGELTRSMQMLRRSGFTPGSP